MDENKNVEARQVMLLATLWQNDVNKNIDKNEKKYQHKLLKLVENKASQVLLVQMLDRCFRSEKPAKICEAIHHLLSKASEKEFVAGLELMMMKVFIKFGQIIPSISAFLIKDKIKKEAYRAVIPTEKLSKHLKLRKKESITSNVNDLGELILGEKEAVKKVFHYIELLKNPDIEYISIKISSICALLQPLGHDFAQILLQERLIMIYREAMKNPIINKNGEQKYKFVNLDMEEYKDMRLTYEIFTDTLSLPEFKGLKAGIVLQAYIPDSYLYQKKLVVWALKRVKEGGSPIKVRLVKGANLQMERVEASIKEWENPIFPSKIMTDAHYKKMLRYGLDPKHIKAINMGIASHNIFDISYAYLLGEKNQVLSYMSFEMLEGISPPAVSVVHKNTKTDSLILYTPTANNEHFINAISYLIRRLDENTAKDNFLRYSISLKTSSPEWEFLSTQFYKSLKMSKKINSSPFRNQNRNTKSKQSLKNLGDNFVNEADTDWVLSENLEWVKKIVSDWQPNNIEPIVIKPEYKTTKDRKIKNYYDFTNNDCLRYEYHLHTSDDVEKTLKIVKLGQKKWSKTTLKKRHQVMAKIAGIFRARRGYFIGLMAKVTGKIFSESDTEISEAIDFAEYYIHSLLTFDELESVEMSPKGAVLVISPWNFPFAIPAGGVLASLSTGNAVVLKPAPESAPISYEMAKCFWDAGVPKDVFQLCFCSENQDINKLTKSIEFKQILLTGGTNTAKIIQVNNPYVDFSAETGGKNATIVTAHADMDQAVKNVVYSAFGNSGQKCSATSLLLLEEELFESEKFKSQLKDCAESFLLGKSDDLHAYMGPLIKPPEDYLKHALETLEYEEYWLLKPSYKNNDKRYLSPSIKWNVSSESYTYKNELFGPLLAVMKIKNLDEGIKIANNTGYGLTSGLESLDEREQEHWMKNIKAGNLYINRPTTGAIVQRQPFGGMNMSAFGKGIKAGGPNYVTQFINFKQSSVKLKKNNKDRGLLTQIAAKYLDKTTQKNYHYAGKSYQEYYDNYFSKKIEKSFIVGEDNILQYIPAKKYVFRVCQNDDMMSLLLVLEAATVTKTKLCVSLDKKTPEKIKKMCKEACETSNFTIFLENENELHQRIATCNRLRYVNMENVSEATFKCCAKNKVCIVHQPPILEGRVELVNYFEEQSLSYRYHRYGNLGMKEL